MLPTINPLDRYFTCKMKINWFFCLGVQNKMILKYIPAAVKDQQLNESACVIKLVMKEL